MVRCIFFFLFVLIVDKSFSQDSIWIARTKGKFPFLEYGIGDDRLGGAKMGFLDSNVLVRIVDSFRMDYKIHFSVSPSAYIAKTSVVLLKKEADVLLVHNTQRSGNMKVYGDSAYDYITI